MKIDAVMLIGCMLFVSSIFSLVFEVVPGEVLQAPSLENVLGTDRLGRSIAILTLQGTFHSIFIGVAGILFSFLIGLLLTLVSFRFRRRLGDRGVEAFAESIRAFPVIIGVIVLNSVGVPGFLMVSLFYGASIWRVLRQLLDREMSKPYAVVAMLAGIGRLKFIARHALPNVWKSLMAYSGTVFAEILAVQTTLEFLGFAGFGNLFGLGSLMRDALWVGPAAPWTWVPATICLSLIAVLPAYLSTAKSRGTA